MKLRQQPRILLSLVILSLGMVMSSSLAAKTLKIATVSPDGLGSMKKMRDGMKEVAELTDGRVKFKIYPGGVQGDDFTVLRKMRVGQLHGGILMASALTRFYPDLQVYNLPLQFRNRDEVDYVRERMDQRIIDGLYDNGVVSFSLTDMGFAYLLSKHPVRSIEELRNSKMWIPDGDPIAAKQIQSFGISPIPLPIVDVLAGLQTGLIDVVMVPPMVALALQWHNHVEYLTDIPLMYIYSMLSLDKKAFSALSREDQGTVRNVMDRVFKEIDADNRADNEKAYDALISQGLTKIEPDYSELDMWRAIAEMSVNGLVAEKELSLESVEILRKHLSTVRANSTEKSGE